MFPQDCAKLPTEIYLDPKSVGSPVALGRPARTFSSSIQVIRAVAKRSYIFGQPSTRP